MLNEIRQSRRQIRNEVPRVSNSYRQKVEWLSGAQCFTGREGFGFARYKCSGYGLHNNVNVINTTELNT